ncbi:MAG: hypothetical protein M3245_05705, partial [Actinomycetota bacterium]|nr:hypothetical protein [Actinomycetota bacterium]
LRANLDGGPRRTLAGGLAVYGRAGRPCRRCGERVRSALQGRDRPRRTYWCPACQGADRRGAPFATATPREGNDPSP